MEQPGIQPDCNGARISLSWKFAKLTRYNPNLDLVNVNVYANFDQIPSICSEDIQRKRNFDNNEGTWHVNLRKLTRNNSSVGLVSVNAYIVRKWSRNDRITEWRNHKVKTVYPHPILRMREVLLAVLFYLASKVSGCFHGVVGWCEGAVYLTSPGRLTDIGLQLGKACYPCSG